MACVVSAALLLAARAGAQQRRESPAEVVAIGVELRAAGRDAQALEAFERAYRMAADAPTLAQIALAEQALRRWVAAEAHMVEALGSNAPWIVRNRATLEQSLADIRQHLGSLMVEGEPAGAEVRVRGAVAGTIPLRSALRVESGVASLEVRAPGRRPVEREVQIEVGRVTTERVALERAATGDRGDAQVGTPGDAGAPEGEGGGTLRTLGFIGLALGGALVAGGIVANVVHEDNATEYNDERHCEGTPDDPTCQSLRRSHAAMEVVAPIGYGVGGAMVVAALVVVLVTPSSSSRERASASRCLPGPGQLGVTCEARF